jgi:hypothetical protein
MNNPTDTDIAKTYNWLMSFITPEQWKYKKNKIEKYLKSVLTPKKSREEAQVLEPVAIYNDTISWYIYLAETYLYSIHKYEPIQGARVMPIFKRIGIDLEELKKIEGINKRIIRMLSKEKNSPDSVLFEITTALLWVRNGWKVSFIEESTKYKSPDLRAVKSSDEYYIECKRLSKSSEYSIKEREKWLLMWQKIRDKLTDLGISFLFDIVFHVELNKLPDDFLVKELLGKLRFVTSPCEIIKNEICTINIDFVNL